MFRIYVKNHLAVVRVHKREIQVLALKSVTKRTEISTTPWRYIKNSMLQQL